MIRSTIVVLCCLAAVLSLGVSAHAQEGPPRKLADDPRVSDALAAWSEWVEFQLAVNGVPGASVAVVHDQELLLADAFGLANRETGVEASTDTIFSICSNSKLFTSIGVMQLRDAGRLRLDDPVSKYLEWFDIEDIHPDDEPITLRRILTHSSGLPRESDFPYWSGPDFVFPTHDQIVERLSEQSTLYPSGRYFQYSNLGLTLAGEIVAATSGRTFDDYIRAEILDPLGMADTFTEIPAELHGGRLAIGYSARNRDGTRDALPLFQVRGIAPAAGFASTVEDLAGFASWQFRLLGEGGDEVLRAATLREMQRVHWVDPDWETTWGLGFVVVRAGDSTMVGHGGGCPGYISQVMLQPSAKLAVIVLTNAIGAEVRLFVEQAFKLVGPAVAAALAEPDGAPKRDPELDRYVGVYDTEWGQHAVVRWGEGLAAVALNGRDPAAGIEKLRKVGEHTFRWIRDDDGSLGETVVFEVDADGRVLRSRQHSNWSVKVR
jgi:CubicO group peptidase (beta-lactamase class C family)